VSVAVASPAQRLAQADLLLALARAFAPPTPALLEGLAEVAAVADDLAVAAGAREPVALATSLRAAAAAAAADGLEAWSAEHQRLFACGVVCPLHETGFVRRDKGNVLGDIAGFYRAFGLTLREEQHERLDHLSAELEFLGLLLLQLARAHDRAGDGEGQEQVEVTFDAAQAFADDHLGEWLPGFARRLVETTTLAAYAHLADALAHAWASVAPTLGVDDTRGRRLPAYSPEPGDPYECGMADLGLA
jgi:TorA maturation chaperone TorD